jgi:hypothetical protein
MDNVLLLPKAQAKDASIVFQKVVTYIVGSTSNILIFVNHLLKSTI